MADWDMSVIVFFVWNAFMHGFNTIVGMASK